MGIIHVLDEQLTNMIAAGEVVDRPVNIVKECVENSLDAGAGRIDIEVFEGGIEGVIVSDDGCGMSYEDARMAFERHATSKISSEEELFSISTMGFRGEALPSIASVARVSLQTSSAGQGTRIEYEYGQLKTWEHADVPQGCRIEVRGLFLHTPARFKYLKKPAYEFSVIADAVNKIALAHPDVRFSLFHDGRLVFQTSGKNDRQEILYQMFGRQAAQKAEAFRASSDDFVISGYAIQPDISRASKSYIYLSLNGRTIRSWPIVKAVIEGYREYLPKERYPICFINIETDFQLVDVNVHPNKLEVRISKEEFLSALIVDTIRSLFSSEIQAPDLKARGEVPQQLQADLHYPIPPSARIAKNLEQLPSSMPQPSFPSGTSRTHTVEETPSFLQSETLPRLQADSPSVQAPADRTKQEDRVQRENRTEWNYPVSPAPQPEARRGNDFFAQLRVIGQLKNSYILCEGPEGLVIIDQHAAAERANFEKIEDEFEKPHPILQPLMVPVRLELPVDLAASIDSINEKTAPYGLVFEPFGRSSILLREEPAWLSRLDRDGFLNDLFSWYRDHRTVDIRELRRHMVATIACHSSVRFHHSLRREEMEQIITDLRQCRQPYHCPHGRPTVITMSLKELSKEFERG